ncbi:MAG: DNA primase [Limnochordia bacterium]
MLVPLLTKEVIEEVRVRNDIVDIISGYVDLKQSGKNHLGLCPFHSERTPSFTVSAEKQLYYCFGCGAGGNVFNFIMDIENLEFVDAVKFLATRVGVTIEQWSSPESQKQLRKREAAYAANEVACEFYVRCLAETKRAQPARDYLAKRGLSPKVVEDFQLGYAPAGFGVLKGALGRTGIDEQTAVEAGLLITSSKHGRTYDRFRHRIMFPIWNPQGRIIGFGGRILDGDGPKYLNSPESPIFSKKENLYGLHLARASIRREKRVVVVEGYMDCISLHQVGITNVVASLGTAFTREHARLLAKESREVVIAYDADTAGIAATLRSLDILAEQGLRVLVMSLPLGEDPDSFIQSRGVEGWKELEGNALSLLDFKIHAGLQGVDKEDSNWQIHGTQAILPILLDIESPVVLETYLGKVSTLLDLPTDVLRAEVDRHKQGQRRTRRRRHITGKAGYNSKDQEPNVANNRYLAERRLLQWVLLHPDYLEIVRTEITEEYFACPAFRRIYCVLLENNYGSSTRIDQIYDLVQDDEVRKTLGFLLNLSADNLPDLQDCINRTRELYYRRWLSSLEKRLKNLDRNAADYLEELADLLIQYRECKESLVQWKK